MSYKLPALRSWLAVLVLARALTNANGVRADSQSPALDRYEVGVMPTIAGDSDVGLKLGIFGQLARFRQAIFPYDWRAQVLGIVSVKQDPPGLDFPFRRAYLRFDWPGLVPDKHRLQVELNYLQTTNRGYYGLGNESRALPVASVAGEAARRYNQFDGSELRLTTTLLVKLLASWYVSGSARIEYTFNDVYPESRLAEDLNRNAIARVPLYGVSAYWQVTGFASASYDTRDHETVPTRGVHLQLSVRASPGAFTSTAYLGANATLRAWLPLFGPYLVLGARLVLDIVTADAPLAELGRYGGIDGQRGPAGGFGVRGVPDGRLNGRTKLIGNLEARSMFLPLSLGSLRFVFGVGAFLDAGRVYARVLERVRELDGSAVVLHPGYGGGVRLRWGDSMLIRADVAYAPLGAEIDRPLAVYVDVEHVL